MLFIVFIDDIDVGVPNVPNVPNEGIRSTVLKFADDTKLVARVGSEEDRERLRQDLIELFKWSEQGSHGHGKVMETDWSWKSHGKVMENY